MRNNHNQRERGGRHADCSRLDDDAGNVRCILRVLAATSVGLYVPSTRTWSCWKNDTMRHVRQDNGISYGVYSLEMVAAVAFRLRTKECMVFRQFVMDRLYTNHNRQPTNLFLFTLPI